MQKHTLLAMLIALLFLFCQCGHCDLAATSAAQQPTSEKSHYLSIAIMPMMTLSLNADVSKAAWDVIADQCEAKGYRVASYVDTLKALAQLEL